VRIEDLNVSARDYTVLYNYLMGSLGGNFEVFNRKEESFTRNKYSSYLEENKC
jgi:hypothetical protein